MAFQVDFTRQASKDAKRLAKRYTAFKQDLSRLIQSLENWPPNAVNALGKECYKVRFAIAAKNKLSRGGGRAICFVALEQGHVVVLGLYDKAEILARLKGLE